MEKYLVILIITIICYYVFHYCIQLEVEKLIKIKEGFVDTINTSDSDLVKSITTLGQVAKDLQAGGLKVPGNLNVTGTINTDGAISTKSSINASSLVASDRNILTELNTLKTNVNTLTTDVTTLKTDVTTLKKLPGRMRLFQMNQIDSWDVKVIDSTDNKSFKSDEWVCSVQGVYFWWEGDPRSMVQACFIKEGEWWVRNQMGGGGQHGKPIILAIPMEFFDKNNVSTKMALKAS